jgi:hypothetical protein
MAPVERRQLDRTELAGDARDDTEKPLAFRPYIGRGGNEDPVFARVSHYCSRRSHFDS